MRVAGKVCLKCGGDAYISNERLPDGICEMYCIQCGSRDFPDEIALAADTLRKLRKISYK